MCAVSTAKRGGRLGSRCRGVCVASQEIDRLDEDATIYKLTGPILVKQDLEMSKSNVQTRHDFIKKQLYVAGGVWPRCTAGDWCRRCFDAGPRWSLTCRPRTRR